MQNHPTSSRKKTFTYGDYLSWPDEERWEIIDGEPFEMTPGPNPFHQEILGNLFSQIHPYFEEKPCKVYPALLDVLFPKGDESISLAI